MRLPEINRYHDRTAPTPLVPVRLDDAGPTIWCKLEFLNPSGSTKDRIATYILSKALRRGEIGPGGTVVEASRARRASRWRWPPHSSGFVLSR
jgi:cysteine synthase A